MFQAAKEGARCPFRVFFPRLGSDLPEQEQYAVLLKAFAREGADLKTLTFEKAFASRFGIATRTKFLSLPYEQLTTGIKANGKEMLEFKLKVNMLDDLLRGVERPWKIVAKPSSGGGPVEYLLEGPADEEKYKDKKPRYFTQPGSGTKYYWVRVEDLP